MEKVRKSVRRTSRATTIDEVAALAKVSPMTVSRVVNNNGSVRDATRARVLRAVDKLGYTPNLAASALAAAQSTRIALIYSDPSGAYLRELLLGVLRVASRTPIQLVIDCWDDLDADAERRAARKLAKGVAGVILPPPLCESKAAVLNWYAPRCRWWRSPPTISARMWPVCVSTNSPPPRKSPSI